MPVLARNKKAYYDYEILEKREAGLVLKGYEVKSIKTGHISLKGSFVTFKNQKKVGKLPEAHLINAHIPLYKHAGVMEGYDPTRSRKLLLSKKEIKNLMGKKKEQGLTLVPLKIYTKQSLLKLEFGIGKGKKKHDKRDSIKKRETDRKVSRMLKRNR